MKPVGREIDYDDFKHRARIAEIINVSTVDATNELGDTDTYLVGRELETKQLVYAKKLNLLLEG